MLLCKLVVCAPKVALWQANKININYLHICGNIVTWYNQLDCTKFITFGSQQGKMPFTQRDFQESQHVESEKSPPLPDFEWNTRKFCCFY